VSRKGVPISLVMKLTALIAVNLALLLEGPVILLSPPLLFFLVMLDLVLVQSVILGRPLHDFHYTFLIVGLVASIVLSFLAYYNAPPGKVGSLRILETLIGTYLQVTASPPLNRQALEYLAIAERCVTSTLGLLLAWTAGLLVARLARLRQPRSGKLGRRIASFLKGTLIGPVVFTAIVSLLDCYGPVPPPLGQHLRWLGLATSLLLGGLAVVIFESRRDPEEPVNRP
jgi:hypothetical protein